MTDLLEQALKLRDAKKYEDALQILNQLKAENSAPVFGVLGDIHWCAGNIQEAVKCFEQATLLSPKSELASLGLFHTLWELGEFEKAKVEMNRFMAISHSDEYDSIVVHGNQRHI